MKTYWKIILIVVDLATIGFGVLLFVSGLRKMCGDMEVGAVLITLGLLIHYWRKNYFNITKM